MPFGDTIPLLTGSMCYKATLKHTVPAEFDLDFFFKLKQNSKLGTDLNKMKNELEIRPYSQDQLENKGSNTYPRHTEYSQ